MRGMLKKSNDNNEKDGNRRKQKIKRAWGKKYNNLPETIRADVEMAEVVSDNIENRDDNYNEHNPHKESLTHALDLPPPWEKPGESDGSLRPQSITKSNQKKKTKKNQRKKEGDEQKKTVPTFQSMQISSDINKFNLIKDGSQVLPALLIAAFGLFLSGFVLDITQHWSVFESNTAYFMAIPMLLGLKGSLDMTLASRLSSAAHAGYMDDKQRTREIIISSLALVQVQAIICAFITSIGSIIISSISNGAFLFLPNIVMCGAILTTMSSAAFVLGSLTAYLITCSIDCNIDPDNIVTPIVSSFGDACTTGFLALFATFLYDLSLDQSDLLGIFWSPLLIVAHLMLLPIFWNVAKRDELCRPVLKTGWLPLVSSLGLSQIAGIILEQNVMRYKGIAVLIPYINGIGGNLGSVYASRLCSSLHTGKREEKLKICLSLMLANLPLQGIFLSVVYFFNLGHVKINWLIIGFYILASTSQIFLVLIFVTKVTRWLFNYEIDPDNYATPWLTALGDILGTLFLVAAFFAASS
jgi:solute carrier family 41